MFLKTIKSCFVGSEAVTWVVKNVPVNNDRAIAVSVLRLMSERHVHYATPASTRDRPSRSRISCTILTGPS